MFISSIFSKSVLSIFIFLPNIVMSLNIFLLKDTFKRLYFW